MNSAVAVIGAGPAGLTAAYCLARAGIPVDLFEANAKVGGLAKSLDLWGHRVDLGPHRFFSNDIRVNRLWLEVMQRDYSLVKRQTRIHYNNRFFDYPLTAKSVLKNLGLAESARCTLSALGSKMAGDDGSYESWLIRQFGSRLYELFFRTYSEKLWGLPCSLIDADFATQRIQKLSFIEAAKFAFRINSQNKHRTLCDQFAYPHGGTGTLYERMSELTQAYGGKVWLKAPVRRVIISDKGVRGIETNSGTIREYSHVISSMPLNLLAQSLESSPPGEVSTALAKLRFRNTVLVYLRISSDDIFPDQWIYIQSPELKLGRITNFRNWGTYLNSDKSDTVLCLEYWCSPEDECWKWEDATWTELAKLELQKTGLLGNAAVLDAFVQRLPRSYPVYHRGYREALRPVEAYLRTISGLDVIGRYGSFKYNNQDHSILMGLLAAERITKGADHDLWAVNSDSEGYQESAAIRDTGLVQADGA